MSTITVAGFIATSNPVSAYDGVRLAPKTMYGIARAIREGKMPFRAHHDEKYLLEPNFLAVDVRETGHGNLGVWVEFEIDEQEWTKYGNLGGFSISVIAESFEPDSTDSKPVLKIYADAGHFDEQIFQAAITQLEQHFALGGGRLYQFNIVPPAKIIIDFALNTIQAIPPNLLSSWLYDALKPMLLKLELKKAQKLEPSSEAVTCLRIVSEDHQIDFFQIQTNNPEILKAGLSTFYDNLPSKIQKHDTLPESIVENTKPQTKPDEHFFEFDSKSKKWEKRR